MEFVHAVSAIGSVKFLCFFLLKLLKLGEIDGVKFLARKSNSVKFLTNSMSAILLLLQYWSQEYKHGLILIHRLQHVISTQH